jgi:hypothetical protein
MANTGGKAFKAAADWGAITEESRLTIPSEVTDCLSWFTPKKKMLVSIDLSRSKMIVIRHLSQVMELLEERRQLLLEDREDVEDGLRRLAMTYHFFREGTLVVPERRIGLKSIILDHLDAKPGGRLFCLGYADKIEAYSESSAQEIISRHSGELTIGLLI